MSLPAPVQAVLELFNGPLSEVRFADVDAAVLANAARSAEEAAQAVTEQEAQLAELRQTLADKHEALLVLAQRAVAYARVYAESDEALSEQLAAITLPRAAKPRKVSAKAASADPTPPERVDVSLAGEVEAATAASIQGVEAEAEAEAHVEAEAEAQEPTPSAQRKGKRRSIATRDEAQDGTA